MSLERFMSLDFKQESHGAFGQKMIVWRKEAHYYDFSKEVSEQIVKIATEKRQAVLLKAINKDDPDWVAQCRRFFDVPFLVPNNVCYIQLHPGAMADAIQSSVITEDGLEIPVEAGCTNFLIANGKLYGVHAADRIYMLAGCVDLQMMFEGKVHDAITIFDSVTKYNPVENQQLRKSLSRYLFMAHTAFEFIAETKATTVVKEQIPYAWSTPKNPKFYTKTTLVKIAMSRVRNKYLKRSEPTGRKMPWGEVRSHFAHWRVTDPNCQHQWQDRTGEGRKFKCDKCGEIKTLRTFPEGRGNKAIGIVKTNYEVSQT
jgi:hypothetical protein